MICGNASTFFPFLFQTISYKLGARTYYLLGSSVDERNKWIFELETLRREIQAEDEESSSSESDEEEKDEEKQLWDFSDEYLKKEVFPLIDAKSRVSRKIVGPIPGLSENVSKQSPQDDNKDKRSTSTISSREISKRISIPPNRQKQSLQTLQQETEDAKQAIEEQPSNQSKINLLARLGINMDDLEMKVQEMN